MQFAQVNRTSPESVYIVATNVEASTITTGYGVAFCLAAGSAWGATATNNVVMTASGTALTLPGFCGVAESDIATNGVGRVISYGYAASVFLSASLGDCRCTDGDLLVPGAAKGGLYSGVTPSAANAGLGYVIALSTSSSMRLWCSGIVRCL